MDKKELNYKLKDYFDVEIKSKISNLSFWRIRWIFLNKFRYIFAYRICYMLYRNPRVPKFIPLIINERLKNKYGPDIDLRAEIDIGLSIAHVSFPFVIRAESTIGKNFHIMQGVSIGIKSNKDIGGNIVIKDEVTISTSSIVLGNITIGNNVVIGAGSFVDKSLPDNTVFYNKRIVAQV